MHAVHCLVFKLHLMQYKVGDACGVGEKIFFPAVIMI